MYIIYYAKANIDTFCANITIIQKQKNKFGRITMTGCRLGNPNNNKH